MDLPTWPGGGRGGGRGGGGDRPQPTYEDGRYVSAYTAEQEEYLSSDASAGVGEGGAGASQRP